MRNNHIVFKLLKDCLRKNAMLNYDNPNFDTEAVRDHLWV